MIYRRVYNPSARATRMKSWSETPQGQLKSSRRIDYYRASLSLSLSFEQSTARENFIYIYGPRDVPRNSMLLSFSSCHEVTYMIGGCEAEVGLLLRLFPSVIWETGTEI